MSLPLANHPAGKNAKPEQFVDNSVVAELEKSGFIDRLYKQELLFRWMIDQRRRRRVRTARAGGVVGRVWRSEDLI